MPTRTEVPAVTASQMRRADELAEGEYEMHLEQMMEKPGARWLGFHCGSSHAPETRKAA